MQMNPLGDIPTDEYLALDKMIVAKGHQDISPSHVEMSIRNAADKNEVSQDREVSGE